MNIHKRKGPRLSRLGLEVNSEFGHASRGFCAQKVLDKYFVFSITLRVLGFWIRNLGPWRGPPDSRRLFATGQRTYLFLEGGRTAQYMVELGTDEIRNP